MLKHLFEYESFFSLDETKLPGPHFLERKEKRVLRLLNEVDRIIDNPNNWRLPEPIRELVPEDQDILKLENRVRRVFSEEIERRISALIKDVNFPEDKYTGYPLIRCRFEFEREYYPLNFYSAEIKNGVRIIYEGNQIWIPVGENVPRTVMLYENKMTKEKIEESLKKHLQQDELGVAFVPSRDWISTNLPADYNFTVTIEENKFGWFRIKVPESTPKLAAETTLGPTASVPSEGTKKAPEVSAKTQEIPKGAATGKNYTEWPSVTGPSSKGSKGF